MKKSIVSGCAFFLILLSIALFAHNASAHHSPKAGPYADGIYLEFGGNRRYWNNYYDYWYPYPYWYNYPDYRHTPRFIHRPYSFGRYYREHRRHHHPKPYKWRTRPYR